jgi:hypothetical protein
MTLNETLRQLKMASRSKLAPETAATMARATQQLESSGLINQALGKGQKAPQFELEDCQHSRISSAELLARGPLLLAFYRGPW